MDGRKIKKVIVFILLVITMSCFSACEEEYAPEVFEETKPCIISSEVATYNNKPLEFKFDLYDYELVVSSEMLKETDYSIKGNTLTVFSGYFERLNRERYTINYSFEKNLTDGESKIVKGGQLTITSTKWSDIIWH